jgi:hypothetical protein
MPVEQIAQPSIDEIRRDLKAYEDKYSMSTAAFIAVNGCVDQIDEDDAVEWLYRAEQLRVLEEPVAHSPYSRNERPKELKNCSDASELMVKLAA